MSNNFNNDYQYDSCISRGICSINPRTSSLQQILVLYLRLTAYYALKLEQNDEIYDEVKKIILNTISIMVSNPEFSESDFNAVVHKFNEILPEIIKKYENYCKNQNIEPDYIKSVLKYEKNIDIIKSIRMGEKEFLKTMKSIPQEILDMYKIMFVLAKSLCTNLLDLESYGLNFNSGYSAILRLLDLLNKESHVCEEIKSFMFEFAEINNDLMKHLREIQIEKYCKQRAKEVSYSTTPGHAVLVVGSNIKELEIILDAVKSYDIDVYTHDEMMLAHTFPKFNEYKNLKGQFGKGMENCLLDFATFPGPIILTRHSLYNVEHLYRGLLYTTDFAYSKGVIPINNRDFSGVIKSAINSKGFKTGKKCHSETIGFDYAEALNRIKEAVSSGEYSRIFIVGLSGYSKEPQDYVKTLIKKTPKDVLVISLSQCIESKNIICLNSEYDTYIIAKITESVSQITKLSITVFFPMCNRHTISKIIYIVSKHKNNVDIYLGQCTPIMLNPNLITTFRKMFKVEEFSTVKHDLEKILTK